MERKGKRNRLFKRFVPIEVKFKSKISKEDVRWIKFFLKKYGKQLNVENGYVITRDLEGKIDNIYLVPLWQFCFKGLL